MLTKMKLNSIKARLLVITLLCLIGMAVLIGNQLYNTDRLAALNHQHKQLSLLSNELLQLRREEKDFLLYSDMDHVTSFNQRVDAFQRQLQETQSFFSRLNNNDNMFEELEQNARHYQQQFSDLVQIQNDIGLDENMGYQGRFRQATHDLERAFQRYNQVELQIKLLQMRRSEKDFLLRKRKQYIQQQAQRHDQLRLELEQANDPEIRRLLPLLEDYQDGFSRLASAYQAIGLNREQGIKATLHHQANQVESQLEQLEETMASMILRTEQQVKRVSIITMVATAATIVILLVKSFITFQLAFSNFVMFFHRCKREYQHMDEKKLGFSEFKYLGAIANEMIDARREMEIRLQKANAQIAQLVEKQ